MSIINNKKEQNSDVDKWEKLKAYIECGIFFEDDNKPLKKVYDYMVQLENE